jgi:hypothetical protein
MHQYPKLYYPEIYILQGGYSGFFSNHKERCEPQNYVAMQDERHKATCAREMRNFGKNAKLIRTQSYTYGVTATTNSTSTQTFWSTSTVETNMEMEEDETMNTEENDDTFEGIESRIGVGQQNMPTPSMNARRVPNSSTTSGRVVFSARRSVSY